MRLHHYTKYTLVFLLEIGLAVGAKCNYTVILVIQSYTKLDSIFTYYMLSAHVLLLHWKHFLITLAT